MFRGWKKRVNFSVWGLYKRRLKITVVHRTATSSSGYVFPIDDESEDSDSDVDESSKEMQFDEFLDNVGLRQHLIRKICLNDVLKIDEGKSYTGINLLKLFWEKLSSLDYRATTNTFLKQYSPIKIRQISARDFIFTVMHFSDNLLRQDIITKMSLCQLAVPVVLQGVKGDRPEFLSWSLRRIIKKWEDKSAFKFAFEENIVNFPVYTVAFLRIGEVEGFSKSAILNMLMGPFQGNEVHPYFLCKEHDPFRSRFSEGCVEAAWYLPTNTNTLEKIESVTSFLNLRGDSTTQTAQTKFLCKAANLTIVFIAKKNQTRERYRNVITNITKAASVHKFIVINDERKTPLKKRRKLLWKDNWLFVRFLELENVCEEICTMISTCRNTCDAENIQGLIQLKDYCKPAIEVEENAQLIRKAVGFCQSILDVDTRKDISSLKENSFPLQGKFREWVTIDQERMMPLRDSEKPVQLLHEDIIRRKTLTRKFQLQSGLSKTTEKLYQALQDKTLDAQSLANVVFYFNEEIEILSHTKTRPHLLRITELETKRSKLHASINQLIIGRNASATKDKSTETKETEARFKKELDEYDNLCKSERETFKHKIVRLEHFFRELGQWYEAHVELDFPKEASLALLPNIVAGLLINGHSLELMDGDTGRVPISWVTSVLDQLTSNLKDPTILVVCALGAQSSGKSTFLNSMFGTRFPVSAGPCTKGLFMRVIKVDDLYCHKLGFQYLFIIDSEGVCSAERALHAGCRFDNELVTLSLCISDIAVFNIHGENIDSQTTGLLEIAAHALIRMKESNLYSQCRIVQHGISDVTASQMNKENKKLIMKSLDEATVMAARKEGFEDRYKQFSDIFDFLIDESLQFIPSLWASPMSPPNPSYGNHVLQMKKDLFAKVMSKKPLPKFTLSKFTNRLRESWNAVKSEEFLFNFQDSLKALDFNNLCMALNEWLTDVRQNIFTKKLNWQSIVNDSAGEPNDTLTHIEKECHDELQQHKQEILRLFDTFVSQYERGETLRKYLNWFKLTLEVTFKELQADLMSTLQIEADTKKLRSDIPIYITKVRKHIRQNIKLEVQKFRKCKRKGSQEETSDHLNKIFNTMWQTCILENKSDLPKPMSELKLRALCEKILLSTVRDMGVSTELEILLTEEGGIEQHLKSPKWEDYYPKKSRLQHIRTWFDQNKTFLQNCIEESVQEIEEKSKNQSFDSNLFQYILQKAVKFFTFPNVTREPPNRLKAKFFLHICGSIFQSALRAQRTYEDVNSLQQLLKQEEGLLREEFLVNSTNDSHYDQVIKCLELYLFDWVKSSTYEKIFKDIIDFAMVKCLYGNKSNVSHAILKDLFLKDDAEEYLQYILNQQEYIKNWMQQKMVKVCSKEVDGRSSAQVIALGCIVTVINQLTSTVKATIEKVKESYESVSDESGCYKHWVDLFIQSLSTTSFSKQSELSLELRAFELYDLDIFLDRFNNHFSGVLIDKVFRNLEIPGPLDHKNMDLFLTKSICKDFASEILTFACFEQCPMCNASCEIPPLIQNQDGHFHGPTSHLPRGLMGVKDPKTDQLLFDDCISCIKSPEATYNYPGDEKPHLCKDFIKDYPHWLIWKLNPNHEVFWRWVMVQHGSQFAEHFRCKPPSLPTTWSDLTRDDARKCLEAFEEQSYSIQNKFLEGFLEKLDLD
ncbi:Interferon-induced very large GTPase 1 [Holothuria leucospilota]|uniref:Interferon-induced very large GTPase 1 n=1 Tax=Holothuria leucospilota TaxID=206669 RepID=A0A9Q1BS21_HOLLE|nr:Interferon-induced very large GTPase 1 [Holothuria leucospilota]